MHIPDDRSAMQEVTVAKTELIETLRTNRAQHRDQFERAVEGYKTTLQSELEARISDLRANRIPSMHFGLPVPQDHTDDYDRVIRMVEMSVDDNLTLDENHFAQYVMDDWAWKQQFITANASYGVHS